MITSSGSLCPYVWASHGCDLPAGHDITQDHQCGDRGNSDEFHCTPTWVVVSYFDGTTVWKPESLERYGEPKHYLTDEPAPKTESRGTVG